MKKNMLYYHHNITKFNIFMLNEENNKAIIDNNKQNLQLSLLEDKIIEYNEKIEPGPIVSISIRLHDMFFKAIYSVFGLCPARDYQSQRDIARTVIEILNKHQTTLSYDSIKDAVKNIEGANEAIMKNYGIGKILQEFYPQNEISR